MISKKEREEIARKEKQDDFNNFFGVISDKFEEVEPPKKYFKEQCETKPEKPSKGQQILKDYGYLKIISYNGFKVPIGRGLTTKAWDLLFERINSRKACIILVTGDPGSGKSYTALRMAELIDKYGFDPELQVVFSRKQFLDLISENSPLKRGQCIVLDEAQFSLNARRWVESIQKDLTEQLESIRSRGFIIFIVSIHGSLIDSIIREHLITFQIHCEDSKGNSTFYQVKSHRFAKTHYPTRIGKFRVQLPSMELCGNPNCLTCKFKDNCIVMRAVYEKIKRREVESHRKSSQDKAESHENQKLTSIEIAEKLKPYLKEIENLPSNRLNPASIIAICAIRLGISISRVRGYEIRSYFEQKTQSKEDISK